VDERGWPSSLGANVLCSPPDASAWRLT
jgi:hypothetical protein